MLELRIAEARKVGRNNITLGKGNR